MDKKFRANSSEELFVDKFVGREDLLAMVDEAIADVPNNHLITLVGPGGIGKTALLRKIYNKYKDQNDIAIVKIDYSQAKYQSFPSVAESVIVQMLANNLISPDDLQAFRTEQKLYQKEFKEKKERNIVEQREFEAFRFLIQKTNKNFKNKRLIILSDSVEAYFNPEQEQRINKIGAELKNTVTILAGRPEIAVPERFETQYSQIYGLNSWKIHDTYRINKFTIDETKAYFAKVLPALRQPEVIDTIHILSAGKPILLAFTVEWFKRHVVLPKYINKSKEELEALDEFHLSRLRRNFELELIRRVQALDNLRLDKALLFLSFLDRRYDKRILQLVLNRPLEYVEELEADLRQMAFIRSFLDDSSGLLHDEAKRLIYQYAWPPYDPTHEDRDELARKVIEGFYLPEIKKLRDEAAAMLKDADGVPVEVAQEMLAHELEMECLDYHYRISPDEGRRYVTKLIEEGMSLRKREGIRHEITMRVGKSEAKVALARMNVRRGQYKGVRQVLERALAEGGISPWYKTTLLRELSQLSIDPQEKAAYLTQAINIAEQAKKQLETAKIYNALGLMYRRQGLWPEAEKAYDQTLTLLRFIDNDNEVPDEKASTLNNLAYVKLLQGELDFAENLADIALNIREKRGNQLWIAFSYLTKGEIAERKGYWDQARRAYQRAASLFEKLGRDQNHAQALIRLSKAKHVDRDFEAAERLLKAGLEQPLSEIRAEAERELGALHRTQGMESEDATQKASQYKAAVTAFEQSLQTSTRKRDSYRQAQALYDLTFMGFLTDGTIHEEYAEQLNGLLAKHNYPILKAELAELYADLKYQQHDVIAAFQAYIEVANILSKRHVGKYNNMLERFKQKFLAQPHDTQEKLCEFFEEVIAESSPGSRLRSMLNTLCRALQLAY